MLLADYWQYISGLLAIFAALDQVAADNWKSRIANRLTSLNRRTFTYYVAENSHEVFERIFSKDFLSWRFFYRSAVISLIFFIAALSFLYFYFPHTFYSSTSFLRSYLVNLNSYFAAGIPVLIFIFFDFICNAQTKYFLEVMRGSGGLVKFLMIGYGDLVVTSSIGIVSVSIALLIFSFFSFTAVHSDAKIIFDFSKPYDYQLAGISKKTIEDYEKNNYFYHVISYQFPLSDFERELNRKEKLILKDHPRNVFGNLVKFEKPKPPKTFQISEYVDNDVVRFYSTDADRASSMLILIKKHFGGLVDACDRFANAVKNERQRFKNLDGWNIERISSACKDKEMIEVQLDFHGKPEALSYREILGDATGELISLVVKSILFGFRHYIDIGPTYLIRTYTVMDEDYGLWLTDEDLDPEATFDLILTRKWMLINGGDRFIESGGYPWSTFFVVTLFTSMFIWFVIVVCVLLYPAILLIEKFCGEKQKLKIDKFPFTTIYFILFIYLIFFEILIGLV